MGMKISALGHAHNIPRMQIFTWIFRNPQSKSYMASLTWLSVSGNFKMMHCGILIWHALFPDNISKNTLKRNIFSMTILLQGYESENKYIASQGPTDVNELDFWLMIWQQNVKHIVMTTRLSEGNKVRLQIELKRNWRLAFQLSRLVFILEVLQKQLNMLLN